jgi:hypothetical protein
MSEVSLFRLIASQAARNALDTNGATTTFQYISRDDDDAGRGDLLAVVA